MEIAIKNLQHKIPINPRVIKKIIFNILAHERSKGYHEITLSFVSDQSIKRLNKIYLGKNMPTDVLAFDISMQGRTLADIIISTDTAMRNAKSFKTTPEEEIRLYLAHGLLHLCGYNDHTIQQREMMRQKEEEYTWQYRKQRL